MPSTPSEPLPVAPSEGASRTQAYPMCGDALRAGAVGSATTGDPRRSQAGAWCQPSAAREALAVYLVVTHQDGRNLAIVCGASMRRVRA
jgi:hypothetical protein